MAEFFRSSKVWVVDFSWEGRPRVWYKALPAQADAQREMAALLQDWYGGRARLLSVRPATPQEELDYIRGDVPKNMLCPTGRAPRTPPRDGG